MNDPDAAGTAAIPEYRMVVPVDKLLQLKTGIENERDRMRDWLRKNDKNLRHIPPPANDPCSIDTMKIMSRNGQQASDAMWAYVDRLDTLAEKLGETAADYGLAEDENVDKFQQGPM